MSKLNKLRKLFVGSALAVIAFAGQAGGTLTGGSTELTQMLNNVELLKVASDGAVTAAKSVQQHMLQIQQYQTQLQNLAKLENLPAALGGDLVKAYNDLNRYKAALTTLQGSLSMQTNAIERRLTEARLSGKDWKGYLKGVSEDVAAHKERALERLRYEEKVISQVRADYEFARNLQAEIPQTVGTHQSIQMLNTQMNRVITQNAKMLEVVSSQIGIAAEADARKAVDKTQQMSDLEIMRQRQRAFEDRQKAFGGF